MFFGAIPIATPAVANAESTNGKPTLWALQKTRLRHCRDKQTLKRSETQ